ncbi:MAG: hypothetical protein NTX28_07755 [Novosphingobium sp.]|nr:hypothetical protein [Novosphingobium sp.]
MGSATGAAELEKNMNKHTATFSDGTVVERNFKKTLPYVIRSVNVQNHGGRIVTQSAVGFSSSPAKKNLFGKLSGETTTEVVRSVITAA